MASLGLILGAGGIVGGAYHAGTLAGLVEATGWDPRHADLVVGTSAGSGIGASLRAGFAPADMLARAVGDPLSEEGARLVGPDTAPIDLPLRPPLPSRWLQPAAPQLLARALTRPWQAARPGATLSGLLPAGTVPTAPIGERVRTMYRDSGLRWPDRPLWICAVRLRDGRRVVFGRDPVEAPDIGIAVEASSAIPGFFRPVRIGEDSYVDGGVHSPTNADLAASLSLDALVVISPMSAASGALRPSFGIAGRLFSGWSLAREVRQVRAQGTKVVVIEPTARDLEVMGANAMDPRRRADVAKQARDSALSRLRQTDALAVFADLS